MKFGGRDAMAKEDFEEYYNDIYRVENYINDIKNKKIDPNDDPNIIITAYENYDGVKTVYELLELGVDPNLVNVEAIRDQKNRTILRKLLNGYNRRKLNILRKGMKNLRENPEQILSLTSEFLTGKRFGRKRRRSRRSRR